LPEGHEAGARARPSPGDAIEVRSETSAEPGGTMADHPSDSSELAKFGYRQELDRSLGKFSSFAAGFSYISILTGVFQLFFFGFSSGGPAFFWTWPTVLAGQFLVALCFAELAGQFPLAGSVYQWSKQIARPFTSWMAGWIMLVGSVVTIGAVAVAYQVILPQISDRFQFVGGPSDVGVVSTPGGAKNAVLLAVGLIVFTTVVNMIGVRVMAYINNFGVAVELVGVVLLIVLLAVHTVRGPGVVTETFGTGDTHPAGYLGAFLVAGLMSSYVLYGFDTAGSLAEETVEPRRHAPPGIIRALLAAGLAGGLVLLFALMSVPDIHAGEIASSGLPYIVKSVLGEGLGDFFLALSAIAITVCCLACHTGGIRMMFSMARDNRLPFGPALARVSEKSKTPVVPAVVIGAIGIGLLLVNIGNQRVFFVLTSVAIILFYLAYLCVTGPLLIARLTRRWPKSDHGPYFSLGRWGLLVNAVAVAYQVVALVNLAWPRPDVYGGDHWYYQWGAFVFCGAFGVVGATYYLLVVRRRAQGPVAEAAVTGDTDLAAASET
jgi:urea carboxylase system permease